MVYPPNALISGPSRSKEAQLGSNPPNRAKPLWGRGGGNSTVSKSIFAFFFFSTYTIILGIHTYIFTIESAIFLFYFIFFLFFFGGDNPRMGGGMSPPSPPGFTPMVLRYVVCVVLISAKLSQIKPDSCQSCLGRFLTCGGQMEEMCFLKMAKDSASWIELGHSKRKGTFHLKVCESDSVPLWDAKIKQRSLAERKLLKGTKVRSSTFR